MAGKGTILAVLKVCAAGAAVLAAFLLWPRETVEVGVTTLEKGDILDVVTTVSSGTLKAAHQARVRASAAGDVEKVFFRKGDGVKKGDLVVKLKNSEHLARLNMARANLAAGEASRRQAELRRGQVSRSFDRTKKLYDQQVASENSMEQAATEKEVSAEVIAAADANLSQLRAAVEIATSSYESTFIRAPFDGVLAAVNAEAGESLGLGMQAFEIYDDSSVTVEASLDEVDAVRVKPGMVALLATDALPGLSIDGRVGWVSPLVSHDLKGGRNVDVTIKPGGRDPGIRVGMSLDVEIVVERRQGVLRIPTQAVMGKGAARHVLVVEDGYARKRAVQAGIANWESTEIVSGISPADRVVFTLNAPGLAPDVRVRINPSLLPQKGR